MKRLSASLRAVAESWIAVCNRYGFGIEGHCTYESPPPFEKNCSFCFWCLHWLFLVLPWLMNGEWTTIFGWINKCSEFLVWAYIISKLHCKIKQHRENKEVRYNKALRHKNKKAIIYLQYFQKIMTICTSLFILKILTLFYFQNEKKFKKGEPEPPLPYLLCTVYEKVRIRFSKLQTVSYRTHLEISHCWIFPCLLIFAFLKKTSLVKTKDSAYNIVWWQQGLFRINFRP